jgi:hypothetical protein
VLFFFTDRCLSGQFNIGLEDRASRGGGEGEGKKFKAKNEVMISKIIKTANPEFCPRVIGVKFRFPIFANGAFNL